MARFRWHELSSLRYEMSIGGWVMKIGRERFNAVVMSWSEGNSIVYIIVSVGINIKLFALGYIHNVKKLLWPSLALRHYARENITCN